MLLYCQRPSRIAELATDHVSVGDIVTLMLGSEPLHLPPQIGDLVIQLMGQRNSRIQIAVDNQHPWLFPVDYQARTSAPNTSPTD